MSQRFSLTDHIQYQAGSVVSREILKTESGSVTLFAFDKDQGLSEHTTPFEAMVYVLDGEAEIAVSSKARTVKAGEMIHMPANKPHALKAKKPFKMLLTMIEA